MPITLSLSSADLDEEDMQELTRQLCRDLTGEDGIAAAPAAEPSEAGAKGDLELIGQILIKALGADAAIAALVGVLKAYVQRKPSLQFEFQNKGGDKLKIKADDLRADDMMKLVQTIKKAVERMNDRSTTHSHPDRRQRISGRAFAANLALSEKRRGGIGRSSDFSGFRFVHRPADLHERTKLFDFAGHQSRFQRSEPRRLNPDPPFRSRQTGRRREFVSGDLRHRS